MMLNLIPLKREAARFNTDYEFRGIRCLTLVMALALSACTTQDMKGPIGAAGGSSNAEQNRPTVSPHRYILLKRENWLDANDTEHNNVRDLYTNVILAYERTQRSGNVQERKYGDERYGWVSRLFTSRTETITGAAKLGLSGNGLGVTFPGAVFSFTHKSNRVDGEKFETNINPQTISSSTFLIPPNGVLSIDMQLKTSTRVVGQYAARALEMVSSAVGTVAPKIKLVNELNKPNLLAAAAELDKGISRLQADDVDETATAHFNLSTWTLKSFATAEFRVPWDVSNADNKVLDDMVRVGSWKIYLKCPRVSIFSERNICVDTQPATAYAKPNNAPSAQENFTPQKIWKQKKEVARELSNREILNFKIAPDKTIGEFAKAQTWYQDWLNDRKPVAKGPDDTVRDQRFCDNAAHSLGTAGQGNLSAFDAGMAVRSLINDMPDFVDFREQMIGHCKDLVRFRVPFEASADDWSSVLVRPGPSKPGGTN